MRLRAQLVLALQQRVRLAPMALQARAQQQQVRPALARQQTPGRASQILAQPVREGRRRAQRQRAGRVLARQERGGQQQAQPVRGRRLAAWAQPVRAREPQVSRAADGLRPARRCDA